MAGVLWSSYQCLSAGEMDLGFIIVEHSTDKGNAKPIRETLRRPPLHYQQQRYR